MRLERLAKDEDSGRNGCPTVYLGGDGSLVVQGDVLDADTERDLENVVDDASVRIKPEIVTEALRGYHDRRR